MKFSCLEDIHVFLIEINQTHLIGEVDEQFCPTDEMVGDFIKRRSGLQKKLKDNKKSSGTKSQWRQNRYEMMKGIKSFHKSTKGKRFHRRLGKFLATRITRDKEKNPSHDESVVEKSEFLKALNSAKTHFFIELEYFHQIEEQIQIEEIIFEYAFSLFRSIETKIISGTSLNENELTFLMDITETASVVRSLADKGAKLAST